MHFVFSFPSLSFTGLGDMSASKKRGRDGYVFLLRDVLAFAYCELEMPRHFASTFFWLVSGLPSFFKPISGLLPRFSPYSLLIFSLFPRFQLVLVSTDRCVFAVRIARLHRCPPSRLAVNLFL